MREEICNSFLLLFVILINGRNIPVVLIKGTPLIGAGWNGAWLADQTCFY